MSRKAIELVPINQVQSEWLSVAINFPQILDSTKIGVNVAGLEKVSKLAGIRHLQIQSAVDETTAKPAVPLVVGFNDKGEAVAGKATKAESVSLNTTDSGKRPLQEVFYRRSVWRDAHMTLNMDEMTRQMATNDQLKAGVRSLDGWSVQLEQSFRNGFRDIGYQNLMKSCGEMEKNNDKISVNILFAFSAIYGGIGLISGDYQTALEMAGASIVAMDFMLLFIQKRQHRLMQPLLEKFNLESDFRASLTFGPEWERYLRLKHQLPRIPLVRPLDVD